MKQETVFQLLEKEVRKRDNIMELSLEKPDPLYVAREYKDAYIALICALFGYGNAAVIVRFLRSLDFSLLDKDEVSIKKSLSSSYYRFQNSHDIIAFFIALQRLKTQSTLESIFLKGYQREGRVLDGISALIQQIHTIYPYESRGYRFLLSKPFSKGVTSPYKRWNMFVRWMVRKDSLDMGLWKGVSRSDLLIPLDTHTFHVSRQLGLLDRKSYDLKAVFELTENLKLYDTNDPVKYDFALYRIGQENILGTLN